MRKTVTLTVLALASLLMTAPFAWMLLSSFKSNAEIQRAELTVLPEHWTLEHYRTILGVGETQLAGYNFTRFYGNSLKVALAVTLLSTMANSFIGYVFAKFRFAGRRIIFSVLLATMMVPFPVTMIPTFLIMGRLHLLDTHLALILPGVIGAYGVFLIRQFVNAIPDDLFAAAGIDGCSELRIFTTIVVPSCKPVMFATALFTFLTTWNDMLWPLILLQSQEKYTLPLALMAFGNQYTQNNGLILAASTITVVPVIILFLFVQRQLIEGITVTGMKN